MKGEACCGWTSPKTLLSIGPVEAPMKAHGHNWRVLAAFFTLPLTLALSLSALLLICLHECLSHLEMRLKSFPKIKTQRTEVALCLCLCLCLALWIESERNGLAWPGLDCCAVC